MNKSVTNFKKVDVIKSPIFEDEKSSQSYQKNNQSQQKYNQSQQRNPDLIASHIKQSYALLDSLQTIAVQKNVLKIENVLY